jgi:uncharacterized protein
MTYQSEGPGEDALIPKPEQKPTGYLTQKQRLAALVFNMLVFLVLCFYVTGEWIPSGAGKRLWLLSGLGFFFLTLVSAPWFRRPRNALVNAVSSAILLSSLDLSSIVLLQAELNIFRWTVVGIAVVIAFSAVAAMVFGDADQLTQRRRRYFGVCAYRISDTLGRGEVVFTAPALISIVGYYQGEPMQQLWLLFGWGCVVFIRPVDLIFRLLGEIKGIAAAAAGSNLVGTISRFDNPDIIRVALNQTGHWAANTTAVACLPNGTQVNVLCLFSHVQESQLIGTGLCHGAPGCRLEVQHPDKCI